MFEADEPRQSSYKNSRRNRENKDSKNICKPDQTLRGGNYVQESKVQFVVDAVYAFAHALNTAWERLCSPDEGYCDALKALDGAQFYRDYLLKVSFTGKIFYNLFYFI